MNIKPGTDITEALQARIDELAARGGGEIRIPAGAYAFRPIELKSNICLHLSAGARLTASPRREDYFPIGYDHNEMGSVHSALYAMGARNIMVKGEGEIDLNGRSFYYPRERSDFATVGPEVTDEHYREFSLTYDWRVNQPIFFHECENIRFEGIHIYNAPCWTVTFNFCRKVQMLNLVIESDITIPNSDGMHFCGSSNIVISGCIVTAGDDCVALSAITDWNRPTENAVISNCVFQSASKALSIGYMHSIVRNVLIENVIVKRSNRAFVMMCHPHTGLVENVRVNNCMLEGRSYAGNWWGNGEPLVIMVTPHHIDWYREPMPAKRYDISVRNISFSNTICRGERPLAIVSDGPLTRNIELRDVSVEIVPEEKPSLKGNVIDLTPGPENYEIRDPDTAMVAKNADLRLTNMTDANGAPARVIEE